MRLSRRRFLSGGLSFPLLLVPHRAVLPPRETEILDSVAEAMLGIEASGFRPQRAGIGVFTDRFLSGAQPIAARAFPVFLVLFDISPVLFSFRRFSSMSLGERHGILRGWMTSRFAVKRLGFTVLKAVVTMAYYSNPGSWDAIGYDGPWIGRVDVPMTPIDIRTSPSPSPLPTRGRGYR